MWAAFRAEPTVWLAQRPEKLPESSGGNPNRRLIWGMSGRFFFLANLVQLIRKEKWPYR